MMMSQENPEGQFAELLSRKIEEKNVILFPEVKRAMASRMKPRFQAILRKYAGSESDLKSKKEEFFSELIEMMIIQSSREKGQLKESEYWSYDHRLKEALQKIGEELNYENLFGKWGKDCLPALKERYDFSSLLYLHLGLCGGAFAIADKSQDRLILQHNIHLQKELRDEYEDTPFIDIPYRYISSPDNIKQSISFRNVLDAMYISIRQGQTLADPTDYSPEFYLYMPHLLPKDKRDKLLPYEDKLVNDSFKFIYCTVGEVLFHLFAWRMLFRKAQYKGIDHEVDQDSFLAFNIHNFNFWTIIKGCKLPEEDWMAQYHKSFKGLEVPFDGETKTIKDIWKKYFVEEIDKAGYRKEERGEPYTMWEEYKLLGMIEQDEDGNWIYTRAFLEMIRYTIHISMKHLNWKGNLGGEQGRILTALHILERRLDVYYQDFDGKHNSNHLFYPTYDNLKEHLPLIDESRPDAEGKRINDCLLAVVKGYLLDGKESEKISKLLRRLHQECRFPIIPYYYELAAGTEHHPKEHLVFCLWDSKKNPIKIPVDSSKNNKELIDESGVAFVLLTINPIWAIRPEYNLMKDNKSIHYASELSEESYNRLFRLNQFFSQLARPIIDEVFYDRLIKNSVMAKLLESEISSFSHEVGKITDQIFYNCNNKLSDLYGKNTKEVIQCLAENLKTNTADIHEVIEQKWRIIPDYDRFKAWSYDLYVWAGNEKELLHELGGNTHLANILKRCLKSSKELYTGAYSLRNSPKPRSYKEIEKYQDYFDCYKKELSDYLIVDTPGVELQGYYLIPISKFGNDHNKARQITKAQNAFIRLIVSTLVNIHEHTEKKEFRAKIYQSGSGHKRLTFQFVNRFDPKDKDSDEPSKGTLPVLKTCLRMIQDEKPNIIFSKLEKAKEGVKDPKIFDDILKGFKKDPKDDFWVTQYELNTENIFEKRPLA